MTPELRTKQRDDILFYSIDEKSSTGLMKNGPMPRKISLDRKRRQFTNMLLVIINMICSLLLPCAVAFPKEGLGWTSASSRLLKHVHHSEISQASCERKLKSQQNMIQRSLVALHMSRSRGNHASNDNHDSGDDDHNSNKNNEKRRWGKKEARKFRSGSGSQGFGRNSTTALLDSPRQGTTSHDRERKMQKRITQLEHLVAKQAVDIRRLQDECRDLKEVSMAFAHIMTMLREAGLDTGKLPSEEDLATKAEKRKKHQADADEDTSDDEEPIYEYFDDSEIFGEAPASVIDAADAAGAAILAGILGGKQRMLVDVRDSELSRDPETLVQFIELAILPVAAGLEGLTSSRNRVKIVFPTVSQLLEYRRTMALAAPEVVALSTLGFDPVEDRDNIVVIVAPPPDNEEGLNVMNELLHPPERKKESAISQPVVVLNHHMVPLSGPAAEFDVMYHLRLLSVQYMSGDRADALFQQFEGKGDESAGTLGTGGAPSNSTATPDEEKEELLEAAMKHAQGSGVNHGLTRAMVIRAYPKPWHVFVDISPATDADFVVAATFDQEPGLDEVNNAIVECLEGSEREDEIVAQQMQNALEMTNGKLDIRKLNATNEEGKESDEGDDDMDDWYDIWNEDSI